MSLTWGPWGTHVSFLSLLPWKLVETCQEHKGDAVSEAHRQGHCPDRGTLCWGPRAAGRCWGADTPLPGKAGSAGRLASLKACGDAEKAAAGTATSLPACPLRVTTGWRWRAPSPRHGEPVPAVRLRWHYSHCCCHRLCCQEAQEGRGDLGDQGDPGGGKEDTSGSCKAGSATGPRTGLRLCPGAPSSPAGAGTAAQACVRPLLEGHRPPASLSVPSPPTTLPCARPAALTRRPSMPPMSAGSPFSPFSPFMPGRPCGRAAKHQPCPCPGVTGAPALEVLPSEPTTPCRHAGERAGGVLGVTEVEEVVAQRQGQTNQEGVLRVCPESQFLPSALLVRGGPGERGERTGAFRAAGGAPSPPRDTRRTVALTYRRAHRSPQPWLPLWTADGELLHQEHPAPRCGTGMRLAPQQHTHLLSFHISGNDGPVWANDDAGLSLLSLQESRRHMGRRVDRHQCQGSRGMGECKPLPSALGSPASQASPGPLLVPLGPARRSTGHQPPEADLTQRWLFLPRHLHACLPANAGAQPGAHGGARLCSGTATPKSVTGLVTRGLEQTPGASLPGKEGWPGSCQQAASHQSPTVPSSSQEFWLSASLLADRFPLARPIFIHLPYSPRGELGGCFPDRSSGRLPPAPAGPRGLPHCWLWCPPNSPGSRHGPVCPAGGTDTGENRQQLSSRGALPAPRAAGR